MNRCQLARLLRSVGYIGVLVLFAACSVSKETKEAVARADTHVQQAQQAVGNAEGGAMELQRAGDHLQQAKQAVEDGDEEPAQRHAQQAELDADLAVAKTQHAAVRKAADELQASIQTLRQEAQRSTVTTR